MKQVESFLLIVLYQIVLDKSRFSCEKIGLVARMRRQAELEEEIDCDVILACLDRFMTFPPLTQWVSHVIERRPFLSLSIP